MCASMSFGKEFLHNRHCFIGQHRPKQRVMHVVATPRFSVPARLWPGLCHVNYNDYNY